ncbi:hypothetical protein [Candidatus Reidiella endopervernicosa]|uniref:Uncharacterized protein n=1 Tax=Candidatus Reidiella endopervernicosa TaxID=2738883 RepID=A0A6N0HZY6_9GAMM|nr:hypothetical protein [Candidatus Reidiella endopervernicosa]QKQ27942.1 hypothetical protein HUE57_17880 [Candidatus Reidiella endopervernicosa]
MEVYTHSTSHSAPSAETIRDEIAYFESRLAEMGLAGDCAYEHALSRVYTSLIDEKRLQIAAL